MHPTKRTLWPVFENLLPWFTLAVVVFYTYSFFFLLPYSGMILNLTSQGWVVTSVNKNIPLQVGDILTRVDGITAEEAQEDLTQGFLDSVRNGATVEVAFKRQGQAYSLPYTLPGFNAEELFGRLNSQWFIPFIFWLAGCAVLLFLRPRGSLRRLLALLYFLNAAWISTGSVSGWHFMGAALALRSLVWLAVPVFIHLHWLFPSPLRPLPNWAWAGLYAVCVALAAASWFQLLPQSLYLVGFILAVVASLGLLVAHVVIQPGERGTLRGMATAVGIVLLPVIVTAGLSVVRVQVVYAQIISLGLVALPAFYFFTLYMRQLTPAQSHQAFRLVRVYFFLIVGSLLFCLAFAVDSGLRITNTNFTNHNLVIPLILSVIALLSFIPFIVLPALADERITLNLGAGSFGFSANRTATTAIFLFLQALVGSSLLVVIRMLNFTGSEPLSVFAAVVTCGVISLRGFTPFQRFFEHTILGMPLAPEALLATYATRITTSLEMEALRALLLDEVFPSLLVRQFAQLEWSQNALTPQFTLRVAPGDLPAAAALPDLLRASGVFLPPSQPSPLPGWIRLALPLRAAGKLRGFWLAGQRDPDSHYSEEDIAILQALADQTALALVNIDQAAALRALYFADIERHEAERLHLAAELHDEVLNQLALLSMNLSEESPAALAAYDQVVLRIREIINGLRPAMLNYGLFPALEALVDELNARLPQDAPRIVLEVLPPESEFRYPAQVELALFRIVQQACANAVQHAQCRTIRIQGALAEGAAALVVSDDGSGFAGDGLADLPALLAGKHFGMAGMMERAALIGANLRFDSSPGQGARVELNWQAPAGPA